MSSVASSERSFNEIGFKCFNVDNIKYYLNKNGKKYATLGCLVFATLSAATGATLLNFDISSNLSITLLAGGALISVGVALYYGKACFDVKKILKNIKESRATKGLELKKLLLFSLITLTVLSIIFTIAYVRIDDFRDFFDKGAHKIICLSAVTGFSVISVGIFKGCISLMLKNMKIIIRIK